MTEALRGKVKWFNNAKGFGFIENGEGDVFVHYSVIESDGFRSLKDGDEVVYEIQRGQKGLQAVKVSKLKSDSDDSDAADSDSVSSGIVVSAQPILPGSDSPSALVIEAVADGEEN